MYVLKNGDSSHILEENYKNMFLRKTPAGRLWQDELLYNSHQVENENSHKRVKNAEDHPTATEMEVFKNKTQILSNDPLALAS